MREVAHPKYEGFLGGPTPLFLESVPPLLWVFKETKSKTQPFCGVALKITQDHPPPHPPPSPWAFLFGEGKANLRFVDNSPLCDINMGPSPACPKT